MTKAIVRDPIYRRRRLQPELRSRHEIARNLLAHGLDPAAVKTALGKHNFVLTMRQWENRTG